VLRLADACMTDTRLSAEEEQLWRAVEQVGRLDHHPEAHAARLKVWLVQWRSLYEQPTDVATESAASDPHSSSRRSVGAAATPNRPAGLSAAPSPATGPLPKRNGAAAGAPPSPSASDSFSQRLGSWEIASSLESYVLHRPMIRADCRLQPTEELALLDHHLGHLALTETLPTNAVQVAAQLAAYHDSLIDTLEPSVAAATPFTARGRRRYRPLFDSVAGGLSPLQSADWFDHAICARALLDAGPGIPSTRANSDAAPLRLLGGHSQLAQGFAGEVKPVFIVSQKRN